MVKIIGDTTSALSPEIAERYQIPIVPQVLNFGTESYLEGVDIDLQTFMRKLLSSQDLPQTAAPPPGLFTKEFERLVPTGEPILCILPSAVVSGTVRSAMLAARDFRGADIRIIDTGFIAAPVAMLLELAARWAAEGLEATVIEDRIYEMLSRCRYYAVLDTLTYLARGGRIGGAAALLGSLLQVKPILTLQKGRVEVFEKIRTRRHALARLKQLTREQIAPGSEPYLSVMHSGIPDQAQELADELATALALTDVRVCELPAAFVVHAGPGVLGVAFFTTAGQEQDHATA